MKGWQAGLVIALVGLGASKPGQDFLASLGKNDRNTASLVYTNTPENSIFGKDARPYDGPNPITASATAPVTAPVGRFTPATVVQQPRDIRPAEQRRFTETIAAHTELFNVAANDMAKGASRPTRAGALCAALPSAQISNWIGRVETLSSNSDGFGVLGIEIAPDVVLKTWNNSFSDAGERTLLQPDGRVFLAASALSKGRLVRFSGTLFRSSADCFHDPSMTQYGSMTNPEFVFRFSDIEAIADH